MHHRRSLTVCAVSLAIGNSVVHAQETQAAMPERMQAGTLEEVIVTANKRAESIATVPMSITAVSGDTLTQLNLSGVEDLPRVVSGLNVTTTAFGTQVYTMRGVGFYDSTLAAIPAVSVYVDEVPLPFAVMTGAASLDPERVEALMGPQGTLFGQNSTGGAINYVAAKPGDTFEAGVTATVGSYETINGEGYISGPLTDTLGARVSFRSENADGWQESLSHDEELGAIERQQARVLLDWQPTDTVSLLLNVNGFKDQSETIAPRYLGVFVPNSAPLANFFLAPVRNAAATTGDAENADWDPNQDYAKDNDFYQASLRADIDLAGELTLTNIASYSDYTHDQRTDLDGLPFNTVRYHVVGGVESLYDELRLSGALSDSAKFVVGASYQQNDVEQRQSGELDFYSLSFALVPSGLPRWRTFEDQSDQQIESYAVFANVDYDVNDVITLHAGARFTDTTTELLGCTVGDAQLNIISRVGVPPFAGMQPGDCVTRASDTGRTPGRVSSELEEDNISWRVGADYKPTDDVLLYANVSRGFKAGGFPVLSALDAVQLAAVRQEELTAYEIGFKAGLLEQTLRAAGAVFYYDYKDKQVRGRENTGFGLLEKLVNIPDSKVTGAELSLQWLVIEGLQITAGASYIDSKIEGHFMNPIVTGPTPVDLDGTSFPNAPEFRSNLDVQYEWSFAGPINGFVGADYSHVAETYGALGEVPQMKIPSYDLLGARAGVRATDGNWSAWLWGRNVTDELYFIGANRAGEVLVNFAGMPRSYGASVSYRF